MKLYSPFEYLCIDIANAKGLDKLLFEERIAWVTSNIYNLEAYARDADDPALYIKAVLAMRQAQAGKPIGHLISLDSVCSGIQVMSALTGCPLGAAATGLICPNVRSDAYTEVTKAMNLILEGRGQEGVTIMRALAKDAVMKAGYGSTAEPKAIFGEHIDVFNQATLKVARGAFELMPYLVKSWNKKAMAHSWTMPDGFHVYLPVVQKESTRLRVDELGGASVTFKYDVNAPSDYSRSNAANMIHSVDAMVLRNMIRRCSYDHEQVANAVAMLESHVFNCLLRGKQPAALAHGLLSKYVNLYNKSGWCDPVIINVIDEDNVDQLTVEHSQKLLNLLNRMLENKPFHIITVHDAFRCLAGNGNVVRYWYKEILAELAESSVLQYLLTELMGRPIQFKKYADIAHLIRNSNYSLC